MWTRWEFMCWHCHQLGTCCWGQPEMKAVKYCWNYAKILPAAVVATGPKDVVLKEIAGGWTAGWKRWEGCNGAMDSSTNWVWGQRHWMQSCNQNTEPDEEDTDVGKHVSVKIWMLQVKMRWPWACSDNFYLLMYIPGLVVTRKTLSSLYNLICLVTVDLFGDMCHMASM